MGVSEWFGRLTGKKKGAQAHGTDGDRRGSGHGAKAAAQRPRATRAQPSGKVGRQADLRPDRPVLGVSAGRGAWVGAVLEASGHGTPHVVVGETMADLLAQAGDVTVVAVDVPMGLADGSRREADTQTRRFVGAQGSSVFTTPVREAVYADTFQAANAAHREALGSGVSQQAYALRRQIMELDAWVRQDLPYRVVEVHPEASLTMMAGAPLGSRRASSEGTHERRDVLARNGIYVPTSAPHGTPTEQLASACAAAWSAHRVKTGAARSFPEQPETFSDGIPAAVHV